MKICLTDQRLTRELGHTGFGIKSIKISFSKRIVIQTRVSV